ncbi:hypothetical protein QFZ21_000054 [Microbacterium sp. W4I20]|nr:hypothetical protein [Microbacterium sp. W4I20]
MLLAGESRDSRGEGDEHRALALPQVVACRLAGDRRIAEDSEDVVAQLERHPDRMPESTQGGQLVLVGAREGGTEDEGLLDAVAGGLERHHPERPLRMLGPLVHAPRRFFGDVEILPRGHVPAHPGVLRPDRARLRVRVEGRLEQVVAPGHEQVAEKDGRRAPEGFGVAVPSGCPMGGLESPMSGGSAASGVGVVDEVVVHESGGLEDLECGADIPERVVLGGVAITESRDRAPSGMAEAGAKTLAADQRRRRRVEEGHRVGAVLAGFGAHPFEEALQARGDGVGDF